MSRERLAVVVALWLSPFVACDRSGPLADLNTSTSASAASGRPPPSDTVPTAQSSSGPPARVMPPRPVPTTNPTVLITMPEQVQLLAIQYMAAMQAPQPTDAPADPAFSKEVADQLRAVGRTDVVSSGRRIDIVMDKGCDATLPREAIARHTGASLTTLLAHGILVVRCADRGLQCLQSTREATDVLCTRK